MEIPARIGRLCHAEATWTLLVGVLGFGWNGFVSAWLRAEDH
jgi:hypothetical protein